MKGDKIYIFFYDLMKNIIMKIKINRDNYNIHKANINNENCLSIIH